MGTGGSSPGSVSAVSALAPFVRCRRVKGRSTGGDEGFHVYQRLKLDKQEAAALVALILGSTLLGTGSDARAG